MIPTVKRAATRRRNDWPKWDDPVQDRRDLRWSVTAGLAVTVVVHLLVAAYIPWDVLLMEPREPTPPQFRQVVEYLLPEPDPPPPERFVETNPDAPLERPEETEHIAARDQRAAQEVPDPLEDSPMPEVDGELEDAHKIVEAEVFIDPSGVPGVGFMESPGRSGLPLPDSAEAPLPASTGGEDVPDDLPVADMAAGARQPLEADRPIGVTDVPDNEDPEGLKRGDPPPADRPGPPARSEQFDVVTEQPTLQPRDGAPVPEARPRIRMRVPPGPLMHTPSASGRMGAVAIDARFSEFGEYQQRMIEAISAQWHILGNRSRYTGSDIGTRVEVHFTLTRDGDVHDLQVMRSSSSRAGTLMVVESIQSRAPFGLWTREMVRVLGESQTVRITFFYR